MLSSNVFDDGFSLLYEMKRGTAIKAGSRESMFYYNYLKDRVTDQEFGEAINKLAATSVFLPTPDEILKAGNPNSELEAQSIWGKICIASDRNEKIALDPVAKVAFGLTAIDWYEFRKIDGDKRMTILKSTFVRNYVSLSNNPIEVQKRLPELEKRIKDPQPKLPPTPERINPPLTDEEFDEMFKDVPEDSIFGIVFKQNRKNGVSN